METKESITTEVIMAGLGGKGVLTIGQVLASSALSEYPHVSYFPSYGGSMRGEACECTVILSDHEIDCPILTYSNTVIIVEPSQLDGFESRVLAGGKLMLESFGLDRQVERNDVDVFRVPAVEIAVECGAPLSANFVLLGAYVGNTDVLPQKLIEEEISKRYSNNEKHLQSNLKAFKEGLKIGERGIKE
jgi:2-oxoglutarate ferredoxin oxidoreductase subunit gamma